MQGWCKFGKHSKPQLLFFWLPFKVRFHLLHVLLWSLFLRSDRCFNRLSCSLITCLTIPPGPFCLLICCHTNCDTVHCLSRNVDFVLIWIDGLSLLVHKYFSFSVVCWCVVIAIEVITDTTPFNIAVVLCFYGFSFFPFPLIPSTPCLSFLSSVLMVFFHVVWWAAFLYATSITQLF